MMRSLLVTALLCLGSGSAFVLKDWQSGGGNWNGAPWNSGSWNGGSWSGGLPSIKSTKPPLLPPVLPPVKPPVQPSLPASASFSDLLTMICEKISPSAKLALMSILADGDMPKGEQKAAIQKWAVQHKVTREVSVLQQKMDAAKAEGANMFTNLLGDLPQAAGTAAIAIKAALSNEALSHNQEHEQIIQVVHGLKGEVVKKLSPVAVFFKSVYSSVAANDVIYGQQK